MFCDVINYNDPNDIIFVADSLESAKDVRFTDAYIVENIIV